MQMWCLVKIYADVADKVGVCLFDPLALFICYHIVMKSLDICIKYITWIYPTYSSEEPHKRKQDIRTYLNERGRDCVYILEEIETNTPEYIRIYDDWCCVYNGDNEILNPSNIKKKGDARYIFFSKKQNELWQTWTYSWNPFPPTKNNLFIY
jgi:hypothetical protein